MPHGLLGEGSATSHPAFADKMKETIAERYSEERVVVDGKLVTSRGPGTAIEFALTLIKLLAGAEKAEAVKGPMLVK